MYMYHKHKKEIQGREEIRETVAWCIDYRVITNTRLFIMNMIMPMQKQNLLPKKFNTNWGIPVTSLCQGSNFLTLG